MINKKELDAVLESIRVITGRILSVKEYFDLGNLLYKNKILIIEITKSYHEQFLELYNCCIDKQLDAIAQISNDELLKLGELHSKAMEEKE